MSSNFLWDLQMRPISYDFLTSLAVGAKKLGRMDVHIIPSLKGWKAMRHVLSPEETRWRAYNMLAPMTMLFPDVESVTVHEKRVELEGWPDKLTGKPYRLSTAGEYFPLSYTVPQWAKDYVARKLNGRKPIVVTLRNTVFRPEFNTPTDVWTEFIYKLYLAGQDVIVLYDLAENHRNSWPEAAMNPVIRAALYEQARMNFSPRRGASVMLSLNPNTRFVLIQTQSWGDNEHRSRALWEPYLNGTDRVDINGITDWREALEVAATKVL